MHPVCDLPLLFLKLAKGPNVKESGEIGSSENLDRHTDLNLTSKLASSLEKQKLNKTKIHNFFFFFPHLGKKEKRRKKKFNLLVIVCLFLNFCLMSNHFYMYRKDLMKTATLEDHTCTQ